MNISICFSPNGTSKRALLAATQGEGLFYDWTLPEGRSELPQFKETDTLIIVYPVYYGRVPKVLSQALEALNGHGARAVLVALYGNRAYDDALIEMYDFLCAHHFKVIGAAAIVGEHAYSHQVATGAPITQHLAELREYCQRSIINDQIIREIPGNRPYKPYPSNDYFKALSHPITLAGCVYCDLCRSNCPTEAIEKDCVTINNNCILCGSCVTICPVGVKKMSDNSLIIISEQLEKLDKTIKPFESY